MSKYCFFNDASDEFEMLTKDEINSKINSDKKLADESYAMSGRTVWNIATVSDKVINNRIYLDSAIRKTITDELWKKKFPKPLLKNHDMYEEPIGRVLTASYCSHDSKKTIGDKVPENVIQYFQDKNCLSEGTGSVILSLKVTEDTCNKIESGLYMTSSQSSYSDNVTCSICGKDIYDEDCPHVPGRMYAKDGKEVLCVANVGALFPVENSIVNGPANDTSTFCVFPDTMNTGVGGHAKQDSKLDFLKEKNKTKDNNGKPIVDFQEGEGMDLELQKVLQSLKATIKDNLLETLDIKDEDKVKKATEIFDGFSDDNLHNLNGFVNLIKTSFSDKIEEVKRLSDEASSFKTQVVEKEAEIEELKKTVEADAAAKVAEEEAKVAAEKEAEEKKAKDEAEKVAAEKLAAETAQKEKDEAEAKKLADEQKKVPNFLDKNKDEKDTKKMTHDFFAKEDSIF